MYSATYEILDKEEQTCSLVNFEGDDGEDFVVPEYVTFTDTDGKDYRVVEIDEKAFDDYTDSDKVLNTLSLPKSVKNFPDYVNYNHIIVDPENQNYSTENNALYNKEKTKLIAVGDAYEGEFVIPGTVEEICDSAFAYRMKITNVVIPNSVKVIGRLAFNGCEFKSVVIPDSVTTIECGTFWACRNLESIVLPDSVTQVGTDAFADCVSLKSAVLPDSIADMPISLFWGCEKLESVVLPSGLREIPDGTFHRCKLKRFEIPNTVRRIGRDAFSYCRFLSEVLLPESVEVISNSAFKNCPSLKSIVIPKSANNISSMAFDEGINIIRNKRVVFL